MNVFAAGLLAVVALAQQVQPLPVVAQDWAFIGAQEETLISWLPRGNTAFLEAMPPKASRACLKMQTSPYAKVRNRAQQELYECGPAWQFWALHFPVPEIHARVRANLHRMSRCTRCAESESAGYSACWACLDAGCFWDITPWVEKEREVKRLVQAAAAQEKIREQPNLPQ